MAHIFVKKIKNILRGSIMNFVQPFIDFASFSFRTNLLFFAGCFLIVLFILGRIHNFFLRISLATTMLCFMTFVLLNSHFPDPEYLSPKPSIQDSVKPETKKNVKIETEENNLKLNCTLIKNGKYFCEK